MSSILDHFPFETPRQVQADFLSTLESAWNDYDVFVGIAPTATGKLPLSLAIADWSGSARIINPNNMLVNQAATEFPELPTLIGQEHYKNRRDYLYDKNIYDSAPVGVTNYHLYALGLLTNRASIRSTLIIDEAHNVIPFLQDQHALKFWHHRDDFPASTPLARDRILRWARTRGRPSKKLLALIEDLESDNPRYVLDIGEDTWRGGGYNLEGQKMTRSETYWMEQLVAKPINIRGFPETLWPSASVKKLVLLSATINQKDIESLGLDNRRVCYINCESPIPVSRRPIKLDYQTSVTHASLESDTALIADRIKQIAAKHPHSKGLVHATYQQATLLRQHLTGPRYIFHDTLDKGSQYDIFRSADPKAGCILIGSGMYEGLDLKDDIARWQGIAKVPWASTADAAVDYLSRIDPEWYLWDTAKNLIQAAGRISRTPTDFGVTYIWDQSFDRVVRSGLLPDWFTEAIEETR